MDSGEAVMVIHPILFIEKVSISSEESVCNSFNRAC